MFLPLTVRLWPRGSKKFPSFTIVVCYKKMRHRGAFLERLGHFNPQLKKRQIFLNSYRLAFWLNRGAQLHPSVSRLLFFRVIGEQPFF